MYSLYCDTGLRYYPAICRDVGLWGEKVTRGFFLFLVPQRRVLHFDPPWKDIQGGRLFWAGFSDPRSVAVEMENKAVKLVFTRYRTLFERKRKYVGREVLVIVHV